ncbi:MAG: hypothetical protein Q8Q07_09030, partial [Dehalococcoidales bacterium]|nr:hypothetical protein [Dehalococcoidales bacterium]
IILFLSLFIGLLIGIGLLFYPNRIIKLIETKFSSFFEWRGRILLGRHYDPQNPGILPRKFYNFWYRLWGIVLIILCLATLYALISRLSQ